MDNYSKNWSLLSLRQLSAIRGGSDLDTSDVNPPKSRNIDTNEVNPPTS